MLSGLAVYIFGGVKCDKSEIDNCAFVNEESDVIDDDDWIFVENGKKPSVDDECGLDLEYVRMPSNVSSCSSSPMIGDWNLTPPSCFERSDSLDNSDKASGVDASALRDMEISVFENLLIEHPSMSVYYRFPMSQSLHKTVEEAKENNVGDKQRQKVGGRSTATVSGAEQQRCMWNASLGMAYPSTSVDEQQRCESLDRAKQLRANQLRRNNLVALRRAKQRTPTQNRTLRQLQ